MIKRLFTLSDAALLYSLFYLPQILNPIDSRIRESWLTPDYHFSSWIFLLLQITALFLFSFKRTPKLTPENLGFQYNLSFLKIMILFGLLTLISLGIGWLDFTILEKAGGQFVSVPQLQFSKNPSISGLIIVTVILSSFAEELFFRSFLINRLKQTGISLGVIPLISTLLFTLPHRYEGFAGLSTALVSGLILSFWFLRKKNFFTLWIAHALFNLLMLGLNTIN